MVFFILKYIFLILNSINKTNIIAIKGINIAKTLITIEDPVSTVETIGFAMPPVVAVEANRAEELEAFIAVAVPPPAIMAKDQVIIGDKFMEVDTITAVPAMAAIGMAMVSNKLSTQGI